MAIVLEKEKKAINWKMLTGILVFVGVVGGLAYLFLSQPQLVDIVAPIEVRQTAELSRIRFDTDAIESKVNELNLRAHVGPQTVGNLGRSNPFLAF
jgi:hypothetical protein